MGEAGILSPLIGHDGAKAVIRSALRNGEVDLCAVGPPSSGKSVALLAIEEAVDGAIYVEASGLSREQLRDLLATDPPMLLIDELDAMRRKVFNALNTALEQRRVTKRVKGNRYDEDIRTQFFAASNDREAVPQDIASRFEFVEFEPYTRSEYLDVCGQLLPDIVEWVNDPDAGEAVARAVTAQFRTRDPRTARNVARLAGSLDRVSDMARALADSKADVDSDPLHPDEIAVNRGSSLSNGSPQRVRMAEPADVTPKSVDEVEQMIDEAGIDIDAAAEAASEDTDVAEEQSLQWLERMIESDNQVMQNTYGQPIVEIVVPSSAKDEAADVFDEWDINPQGPSTYPQDPSFAEENPEVAEGLTGFQFLLDDGDDLGSSGYALDNVFAELEGDIPFVVTQSRLVEASIPI